METPSDRPASISREERAALIERLRRLLPVSWDNETDGHGEPTHAVLTFGEHQTQAITLCPDDWMVLNELPAAISPDERLIEALDALEAENESRTERARTDRELGVAGGVALTLRQIRQRVGSTTKADQ